MTSVLIGERYIYKANRWRKKEGYQLENERDGQICKVVSLYRDSPYYAEVEFDSNGRTYCIERTCLK